MKLKKSSLPSAPGATNNAPAGGAVIADRFRLDGVNGAGAKSETAPVGSMPVTLASIGAALAVILLCIIGALMYLNWDQISAI